MRQNFQSVVAVMEHVPSLDNDNLFTSIMEESKGESIEERKSSLSNIHMNEVFH